MCNNIFIYNNIILLLNLALQKSKKCQLVLGSLVIKSNDFIIEYYNITRGFYSCNHECNFQIPTTKSLVSLARPSHCMLWEGLLQCPICQVCNQNRAHQSYSTIGFCHNTFVNNRRCAPPLNVKGRGHCQTINTDKVLNYVVVA